MNRLLTGLIVACLVCSNASCDGSGKDQSPRILRANAKAPRYLGSFEQVEGTPFLVAPISSLNSGESWVKGSYERGITHNFVFLNTEDESTSMLLPVNNYLISSRLALPERKEGSGSAPTVKWFQYSVIKTDTDGDGELSGKDKRTLAVSDAGGRGYTELIENIEDVLGHSTREPNTLFVIYVGDGTKNVAKIDLANRRVTSIRALPSFGDDVQ